MDLPSSHWSALPASAFESGAARDAVVVLPLGATEQHGPHLPVGTDTQIAEGMLGAVEARLPARLKVLFLPVLAVSNSVEHTDAAGTLSLGRTLTLELILALARSVARAGARKLVIINAHGGNVGVMVDAAHAIRAELGLLCVVTNWMRLGLPDGLIEEADRGLDIHGGRLETSLMLALHREFVDDATRQDFPSLQRVLADEFALLRAYGPIGFGWMGSDIHPSGAVGNAGAATARDGEAIIAHQAERFISLLDEVARFVPPWFADVK